jgi:hypothetical protein
MLPASQTIPPKTSRKPVPTAEPPDRRAIFQPHLAHHPRFAFRQNSRNPILRGCHSVSTSECAQITTYERAGPLRCARRFLLAPVLELRCRPFTWHASDQMAPLRYHPAYRRVNCGREVRSTVVGSNSSLSAPRNHFSSFLIGSITSPTLCG